MAEKERLIRAIILDMDGLMFDTESICRRMYSVVGAKEETFVEDPNGLYEKTKGLSYQDQAKKIDEILGTSGFGARFIAKVDERSCIEYRENPPAMLPGLLELLSFLESKGYPLYIASSSSVKDIRTHLEANKLEKFFTDITSADEVAKGKPSPDVYLRALEKIGNISPEEVLVLEDSRNGVLAATYAGLPTIAVGQDTLPEEILARTKAHYATLYEVIPYLEDNNPFRYQFKPQGYSTSENLSDNEVFISIGNDFTRNILDKHNEYSCYPCTAIAIQQQLEDQLSCASQAYQEGVVFLYAPFFPDADAIMSCYLVEYCLSHSKEEFQRFLESEKCIALLEGLRYATEEYDIFTCEQTDVLLLFQRLCALEAYLREREGQDTSRLPLSLAMIDQGRKLLNGYFYGFRNTEELVAHLDARIQKDRSIYKQEKADQSLNVESTAVWRKSKKEPQSLNSAIWVKPTRTIFGRRYAAMDHYKLIMTCRERPGEYGLQVTISVVDEEDYSIASLANVFELMEQNIENKKQEEGMRYVRNHSESRRLFQEPPFNKTSAPWFVTRDEKTVCSPGFGTAIEIGTMLRVLRHITRMIGKTYLYRFSYQNPVTQYKSMKHFLNNKSKVEMQTERLTEDTQRIKDWNTSVRRFLHEKPTVGSNGDKKESFSLCISYIDSILMSHDDMLLKALALELENNEYFARTSDALQLDERTVIYASDHFAVVLIASSRNSETVSEEGIADITKEILLQKTNLAMLSAASQHIKSAGYAAKLKQKMVDYLVTYQTMSTKYSGVFKKLHAALIESLGLATMKNDVFEAVALSAERTQEKFYSRFELLSVIFIPLSIASTISGFLPKTDLPMNLFLFLAAMLVTVVILLKK